jgi:hypothetical protein
LTFNFEFTVNHRDSGFPPEDGATRWWDASSVRREYPWPLRQCENSKQAPILLEISLRYWRVSREIT